MRILFFTNTAPEYRIPLFQELSSIADVDFVFTRLSLAEKVYGNKIDEEKMKKINNLPLKDGIGGFLQIKNWITNEDTAGVVIPPMDSFIESIYAYWIFLLGRLYKKKIFFYWEKWEAPIEKQSVKKKMKNGLQKIVSRNVFRHADYCFGMGTKACEYFVKNGVKKEKCGVTYNSSLAPFCKLTEWKAENNIPNDKTIVMYFGRIIEKKGLRYLIEAFSLLNADVRDKTWLVICGDGPNREELFNYANTLGLTNMTWLGYVHPDSRYNYFKQCDIFVLPTYHYQGSVEGWGLTINEAIQCGKRVIATTAVGAAFDLINEKNGAIVNPESGKEIAEAITKLIPNGYKISAEIEDARIMKLYNYQNSAKEFVRIFNQECK